MKELDGLRKVPPGPVRLAQLPAMFPVLSESTLLCQARSSHVFRIINFMAALYMQMVPSACDEDTCRGEGEYP